MQHYRSCLCNVAVLCFIYFGIIVGDGLAVPKPGKDSHTCVIGAGIAGLAAARYLQQDGVNYTVYEASRYIGGTWHFDPRVGVDEDGTPLFTSMYKDLRTNTPRQTMEFAGFPMPDGSPSYPSGPCYYNYLKLFADKFGLMKNIQFQSLVTSVKWIGERWNMTYRRTSTGTDHSVICNFVVIGNGHYSKAKWPKFEGEELFKGNIIHSHDYRDPENYASRRVLVVGAGASGLDISTQLVAVASKLVHSHHLVFNQPAFPSTHIKKPDIKMFTSNGVIFQDDSFEEVDDVIYCTGYEFDHPFLDETSGVTVSGRFVLPLYQHMVNIRHPSMVFIGLTGRTITRVLDAQAEYAAALAAGKFSLPSQERMLKSWLEHVYTLQAKNKKIVDVNYVGEEQDNYFANLTAEAGITRAPPVLTEIMFFNARIRLEDLLNYRDYEFIIKDDFNYERHYRPKKELPCPIGA